MAGKLFILLAIGLLVATVSGAPSLHFLRNDAPTDQPGIETEAPAAPTDAPTAAPEQPTDAPTNAPTEAPAEPETEAPTAAPAEPETEAPTAAPADPETEAPTEAPVDPETEAPTEAPVDPETEAPTEAPVEPETTAPTKAPTSTETPYTKPTDIPDIIPRSCAERPRKNDYLMIPSPNSCGKFIVCYDHRETEMACPSGLYFNYWQQYCDWPQNVDCHDQ